MPNAPRKVAFVLASSDHGTMIVNRLDYRMISEDEGFGVGLQILESASFDQPEIDLALLLLELRRKHFGDGVVAIDCGANIGVHTIEWARRMTGWGSVIAIEAQERIFYALAGNIAVNNCFNARAFHAAVAAASGTIEIPNPDYLSPGSFGSLELKQREQTEFIGQDIDYAKDKLVAVPALALDSLSLERVDLIKIDVEGMEQDVLQGADALIARTRPVLIVEVVKSDQVALRSRLAGLGYRVLDAGMNVLAIHASDPCLTHLDQRHASPNAA